MKRALRWTLTALFLAFSAVWVVSIWRPIRLGNDYVSFLAEGSFSISANDSGMPELFLGFQPNAWWVWHIDHYNAYGVNYAEVAAPGWFPTLILAMCAAPFWRHRRDPEQCVCGYSLRGNESGRCPECGRAVR